MIIRSSKANKPSINIKPIKKIEVNKEVKSLENEVVQRAKRKKSTPIAVEEPVVVEEKTEDEDLSQWLEEHTED